MPRSESRPLRGLLSQLLEHGLVEQVPDQTTCPPATPVRRKLSRCLKRFPWRGKGEAFDVWPTADNCGSGDHRGSFGAYQLRPRRSTFSTAPCAEQLADDEPITPMQWLSAGGKIAPVVELAADLHQVP